MIGSNWGKRASITVLFGCLVLSSPLLGFVEQELGEPASQIIEEPETAQEAEVDGAHAEMPTFEPQLFRPRIQWPAPEFGLSVQLSQSDYSSLGHMAFPFSPYIRALFGWLLDTSSEDGSSQRLTHGPVAMIHLSFPNLSTLTPMASFGPAYFFSKRVEEDHSHQASHTIGLMANVGLDLYLAPNFSLLMQQSLLMMESGVDDAEGEEVKSVTRSQIMFQFTF